ncbi:MULTISPECIES: tyrosine-type recombinase/integrase [Microbacterium]|uniref:tyrosine-type recombinase/integrase n=1 Tax=Microbacterium TaxID=33882 RepID=UPI0011CA461A|nr:MULTISPECIES: tyrosine-type recombinase/integrase [Microbacterium]MCK6068214.1 tyrosine-type recombinase/integrase [Microbacterium sp. EYE_512]TXK16185.1 tyrosine-type recombinase/integrase [Microbacterium wangchenii]
MGRSTSAPQSSTANGQCPTPTSSSVSSICKCTASGPSSCSLARATRTSRCPTRGTGGSRGAVRRCVRADSLFPRITPHDLRHTAASLAISAGANVKAVQRMLGHASAAMTLDTYADLFDDDLDYVAEALSRARSVAGVRVQEGGRPVDIPTREPPTLTPPGLDPGGRGLR